MKKYYSASAGGFFMDLHGDKKPADCILISDEKYIELFDGQALGKRIVADEKGLPVLESPRKETLDELKTAKQLAIAHAAQTYVDVIASDFAPTFERESYLIQAAEAAKWMVDKKAETPVLDGIANARGVDPNELKVKAFGKSQQYQALCAIVAGQRQAYEDQINAAATPAEVEAITPIFGVEL